MRHDHLYLMDILEAIARIEKYVTPESDQLDRDEPVQSLVLRYLQVIGEAVRALSPELKARHPDVPWRDIVNARNMLVHHYFDIDLLVIREIVHRDLPSLKPQIEMILSETPRGNGGRPT